MKKRYRHLRDIDRNNIEVVFIVEGDLNGSVFLEDNIIEMLPSEEFRPLRYNISLEGELESGIHKIEIISLEFLKNDKGLKPKSRVVSEAFVFVPYPGKYIDATLNISSITIGENSEFIVNVKNLGSENVENIYANIVINNLFGEKIDYFETSSSSLAVDEIKSLISNWNVSVNPGRYMVNYEVFYDGESKLFEEEIQIGSNNLTIDGILVSTYQFGGIAKIQILVDNQWNQDLEGVNANLIIYDSGGNELTNIRSSEERVVAFSKKELFAFWDTKEIQIGDYDAKLNVYYGDKIVSKDIVLSANEDSLKIFGVGYSVRPSGGGVNMTNLLLIIVIFFLIVNIAWFVYFKRNSKKNSKKKKRKKEIM